ncbi:MAG: hypothetical protein RMJ36_00915 [Candidatus Calescibacterium sp.]|nr:hypothetical protein [Candidatus Calescibacterium sp.]MDW8132203.1 hypothetical protein [Candidatus Calescibacterium sp.]
MDIIEIKKIISEWNQSISKPDNYKMIKTIREIIGVYSKLDEKQKELFIFNFKPIQKKIFDNIYSNDPLLRRSVVNLAISLNTNELIADVIKYLKVEKDYENIMVYLKYIDKFKVVGFIENLFGFAKQVDLPLIIRFKTFSIIFSLAINYKNNSLILDHFFSMLNELVRNQNFNYSVLSLFLKNLINDLLVYYRGDDVPKVVSIFSDFYNSLFFKIFDFIRYFLVRVDNEEKSEILVLAFILIFLISVTLDKIGYFSDEKNISGVKGLLYKDLDLVSFLKQIVLELKNKTYFFLFFSNFLKDYGLLNELKKILDTDQSFTEILVSLLSNDNEKLNYQILSLISEFDLTIGHNGLKKIADFAKNSFNENIVYTCLEIFDKNGYYEDIFYFAKYSSSYGERIKIKIKELLKKMTKGKTEDEG